MRNKIIKNLIISIIYTLLFANTIFANSGSVSLNDTQIVLGRYLNTIGINNIYGANGAKYEKVDINTTIHKNDFDECYKSKNLAPVIYIGREKKQYNQSIREVDNTINLMSLKKQMEIATISEMFYTSKIVMGRGLNPTYLVSSKIEKEQDEFRYNQYYMFNDENYIVKLMLSFVTEEIKIGNTGYAIYVPQNSKNTAIYKDVRKDLAIECDKSFSLSPIVANYYNKDYFRTDMKRDIELIGIYVSPEKVKSIVSNDCKIDAITSTYASIFHSKDENVGKLTTFTNENYDFGTYTYFDDLYHRDKIGNCKTVFMKNGDDVIEFEFLDIDEYDNTAIYSICKTLHKIDK